MSFKDLYNLIAERKKTLPEGSGTANLLRGGLNKILPKFNEECFEVGLALEIEGPDQVAFEVSQCFYYLICLAVLMESDFEKLQLNPDFNVAFESEHDLAKECARKASLVCYKPSLETINDMTPLLFQAIKLKGSTLNKMFSYL